MDRQFDLDEKEIFTQYTNLLAEQRRVAISVNGFPEEQQSAIEAAINEMVKGETIRLAHDRLRAAGVNERFLVNPAEHASLEGLSLNERDRLRLEAKIRQLVMRLNEPNLDKYDVEPDPGKGRPQRPHTDGGTGTVPQSLEGDDFCICVTGLMSMPGTEQYWGTIDPVPAPPSGKQYIRLLIALWIDTISGHIFSGDTLVLDIEDGAQYGLGSDDMQVGLSVWGTISWPKEIYAWHPCRGRIAAVTKTPGSFNPTYLLLKHSCDGADTIVFTKPQFLGIWADVGHYRISRFWRQFGGKRLTFTWITE